MAYLANHAAKESGGSTPSSSSTAVSSPMAGQKSRTASPARGALVNNADSGSNSNSPVPGSNSQSRSRNASPSRSSSRSRATAGADAAAGPKGAKAGVQADKGPSGGLGVSPAVKELQEQHQGVNSGEPWISFSGGGASPDMAGVNKGIAPQRNQQQRPGSSMSKLPRAPGQAPAAASNSGVPAGESLKKNQAMIAGQHD